MDVSPLIARDRQVIQSYRAGKFKVSGQVYDGAVIVFPNQVLPWHVMSDLTLEHFSVLNDLPEKPDVVLIGTGDKMVFLPTSLRQALKQAGWMVDVMDTGAACRTYNVLMAEGRRVAAMLLPLDNKQE